MTLVFFCISNLILYLERLEDKSSQGLFFDLKITSFLLVFALANLVGIAPGIGVLEKIYLAKILLKKKLFLANLIFLSNLVTLLIFSLRLIYQLFSPSKTKRSPENILWAKNIDFDSSLILSSLITAIAIVFLLILFPLITNFF
jgi:formate hydrogenlyase subunit 3/multisubunit Na+/H+ antiporter MnhD subunit